jgi:hypothetical protein
VSDDKLQNRLTTTIKEKTQYFLALAVIVSLLLVVNFPPYVIFFFGIFIYFSIKLFAGRSPGDARDIFEFYLSANEMLRDDERRWYGFEMQEVIGRGERVLNNMPGAPPLLHFAVGALYHKIGDHMSAIQHLALAVENDEADESHIVRPTPELRNYVRILRKIERDPAEAPLTSGSVRALERARRNRGKIMLEESRREAHKPALPETDAAQAEKDSRVIGSIASAMPNVFEIDSAKTKAAKTPEKTRRAHRPKPDAEERFANRQPNTDVLHDIYDRNSGS